ncbi:hypothetical protein GCM10023318_34770 [Nocardia callitridis]|uniref:Uncharacterized protein n=1 Tax=Nocardia callitridis TaxID=648753 RepID=A0ABP9KDS2_9NOCA
MHRSTVATVTRNGKPPRRFGYITTQNPGVSEFATRHEIDRRADLLGLPNHLPHRAHGDNQRVLASAKTPTPQAAAVAVASSAPESGCADLAEQSHDSPSDRVTWGEPNEAASTNTLRINGGRSPTAPRTHASSTRYNSAGNLTQHHRSTARAAATRQLPPPQRDSCIACGQPR